MTIPEEDLRRFQYALRRKATSIADRELSRALAGFSNEITRASTLRAEDIVAVTRSISGSRFSGLRVVRSMNIPRTIVGEWIVPAHPLTVWLMRRWPWRLLNPSPWVACGPIERRLAYRIGDTLFVGPEEYEALGQF